VRALTFEEEVPVVPSAPNRADVACFVGFVKRRRGPVPLGVRNWLDERGWLSPPYRRTSAAELLDVPVPIDSWESFVTLYEWETRRTDDPRQLFASYVGAAVRSFFAQGGKRCYVVRVGDMWEPATCPLTRDGQIAALVPGFPWSVTSFEVDQTTWHGVGHLFGLPDVSFVCLPDLPNIVAAEPIPLPPVVEVLGVEEHFTECSSNEQVAEDAPPLRAVRAPRCDATAYEKWADVVEMMATFLRQRRREVQLLAAVPMPLQGTREEGNFAPLMKALIDRRLSIAINPAALDADAPRGMASSFVQLAYPWVRSPGSVRLPEGLEAPDGVLAGVLARNAIIRGTFRSAAGQPLADVIDVYPLLRPDHLRATETSRTERYATAFEERVSVLGHSPSGMRLLSDVTPSVMEAYRPASVHRLVTVVARAARRLGEEITFDVSGETLWARVREVLRTLLTGLLQAGALRGASPKEAFTIRCDRTTMTQSDIDAGRLIAHVVFDAAAPIEQIRVILSLDDAGQLTLSTADSAQEAA
jgi:hypothetical protein